MVPVVTNSSYKAAFLMTSLLNYITHQYTSATQNYTKQVLARVARNILGLLGMLDPRGLLGLLDPWGLLGLLGPRDILGPLCILGLLAS